MLLPVLKTEHIVLRRPEIDDAAAMQELANDFSVAANSLNIPHPYPVGAAEEWIRRAQQQIVDGKAAEFTILDVMTGTFMGDIGLTFNHRDNNGEIGYWLGQPYRGRGYMTEAVCLVLQYGFAQRKLNRIYASVFSDNPGSRRVLEKCGMLYEGTMRQHIVKWGGYKDLQYFGILRDEFEYLI